ncbi:hypothetical protein THICB3320133 [Thiomonas sp. CB3]|nr:hypothetical protein THICB3320133 [Thiomonas sp. CB3]
MPVDVWIIDGASDAFDGEEVNRRQVRTFMRRYLTGLARSTGGAVLLLAHINKDTARIGGTESYSSGSTAWHNLARSRLALTTDGDLVKLSHEKSNYGRCIDPILFTWGDAGVLIPAAKTQTGPQGGAILHLDGAVLEAIEKAAASGVHVPTATGGARNAARVITELLPPATAPRAAINAALIRLEQRGLIRRVEIVTAARHRREVWATALKAPNAPNEDSEHSAQSAAPNAPIAHRGVGCDSGAHLAQQFGADRVVEEAA